MRLENKIAVITGAAAGIGKATAELFVREGAKVVVADRDGEQASAVARSLGTAASAFTVDVSVGAEVKRLMDDTVARLGRLDILVNNAGYGIRGNVVTTTEEEWDALMAVNLKGVFLCSKYAVPYMIAQGGGAIVNTASTIASVGIADRAAYVASKGGVAALTRAMALDHAADNIRVNSVAPGAVWSSYYEKMLATHEDPETFLAKLKARAPINRWGEPHEIATAILWLASDEASFATGSTMTIDGGWTAW
jgi:NAD(P)-dependent dehydrogenase (short-subunit alcohol dehydrogenase family)